MMSRLPALPRPDTPARTALSLALLLSLPLATQACEFFCTTLRVTHPWTRASAGPQASTAVVSLRIDEVSQADRLLRVSTPVADGAEFVDVQGRRLDAIEFAPGQTLELGETGPRIRLTGLAHPLEMARTYPLTLEFEHGGVIQADLSVDFEAQAEPGGAPAAAVGQARPPVHDHDPEHDHPDAARNGRADGPKAPPAESRPGHP